MRGKWSKEGSREQADGWECAGRQGLGDSCEVIEAGRLSHLREEKARGSKARTKTALSERGGTQGRGRAHRRDACATQGRRQRQ